MRHCGDNFEMYRNTEILCCVMGFPCISADKESACNAGDPGSFPGLGRSSEEGIDYPLHNFLGFSSGSGGKESTFNVGDLGSICGLGRPPGGGHDNPFQYSCLEHLHGQRSLAGYSPWCCLESDTTEQLIMAQHMLYNRTSIV